MDPPFPHHTNVFLNMESILGALSQIYIETKDTKDCQQAEEGCDHSDTIIDGEIIACLSCGLVLDEAGINEDGDYLSHKVKTRSTKKGLTTRSKSIQEVMRLHDSQIKALSLPERQTFDILMQSAIESKVPKVAVTSSLYYALLEHNNPKFFQDIYGIEDEGCASRSLEKELIQTQELFLKTPSAARILKANFFMTFEQALLSLERLTGIIVSDEWRNFPKPDRPVDNVQFAAAVFVNSVRNTENCDILYTHPFRRVTSVNAVKKLSRELRLNRAITCANKERDLETLRPTEKKV